ncbi:CbtB domain-containing protein [Kaistia granuli]|jgi:cobalt transporter subunit CbtB|uniref:CbtB domain-containing protein n=1 Tax=Kaistia granuli TaxID=363259 RepID=UPI00036F4980|nr:CbtB domain-containing protein [Kaistia granuli]
MIRSAPTSISAGSTQASAQARLVPALFAIAFGLFLFIGTGFAAPSLIHNATHDTRHSLGLPCH